MRQAATRYRQNLVEHVHSAMAPGNPVPNGAGGNGGQDQLEAYERLIALRSADTVGQERPRQRQFMPAGRTTGRRRALRLLAPAASALAVLGVVAALLLTGGAVGRGTGTKPDAAGSHFPRFYVIVNGIGRHVMAVVHDSLTGRTTAKVPVPSYLGGLPLITAARSDRAFLIATPKVFPHLEIASVPYLLRIGSAGQVLSLRRLPERLTQLGTGSVAYGIALSPDGAKLAVGIEIPTPGKQFRPLAEIAVFPLHGGPAKVWTAPHDPALPADPVWVGGNRMLAFLWQDHLSGPVTDFTGRSQVRLLDTAAPGRSLLSSRVVASGGGLGFIETAYASPSGGPIIASTVLDSPARGSTGTATVRLVALSPATGKVVTTFIKFKLHYRNLAQKNDAAYSCLVFGRDASGQHTLVSCPRFGRFSGGVLTALPAGRSSVFGAGW